MKMGEARKGLRVYPADPTKFNPLIPRVEGTLTSGRITTFQPPYEEGLFVRVKWDGMPTPEYWHLTDLIATAAK